jgi:hypothetical protein
MCEIFFWCSTKDDFIDFPDLNVVLVSLNFFVTVAVCSLSPLGEKLDYLLSPRATGNIFVSMLRKPPFSREVKAPTLIFLGFGL